MRLLAASLFAALILSGCTATQSFEDGEFTVMLTGSPIDSDGRATFDVTFTLEEPLTYTHPGCSPALFSATVQHGDGIGLAEYGKEPLFGPCVIRETTLPAGAHTATFHWNGNDGVMDGGQPHDGKRLPAGTYDVLIELRGNAEKSTTVQVIVS